MKQISRLHRCVRSLFAATALLVASSANNAWAGIITAAPPPAATASTACDGHPCVVSQSGLLQQLFHSGTYSAITRAMEFATSYFYSGFGRQSGGPVAASRFPAQSRGETGKAASAGEAAAWNAWGSASRAEMGTSFEPLKSDGSVNATLVGVDFTFPNKAIAGIALADSRTRVETSFNNGNFRGDGLMVSPYFLFPIGANWAVNANLGFGRTDLQSLDNTGGVNAAGSNKSTTTLANLSVEYNQMFGDWALTGRAGASTNRDKLTDQTLSDGTFVAGAKTRSSQLRFGGEAAYNAGRFMPYAGLTYLHDSRLTTQSSVSGQTPANDKNAVQATLGVQYRSPGPLYGGVQLASERGRSQIKNDSLAVNVGLRF